MSLRLKNRYEVVIWYNDNTADTIYCNTRKGVIEWLQWAKDNTGLVIMYSATDTISDTKIYL